MNKNPEGVAELLNRLVEEQPTLIVVEVNVSAVKVLGEPALKEIAQQLVKQVRANVSIDCEIKESARARMRVIVKRILRKYGYPPDKQQKATETVVKQAELLSKVWVRG